YWSLLQCRLHIFTFEQRSLLRVPHLLLILLLSCFLLPSTPPRPAGPLSPGQVIEQYFEAVDAGNLDAIMHLMSPDARLYFGSLGDADTVITGYRQIRTFYVQYYLTPVSIWHQITGITISGTDVFVRFTVHYPDSPTGFPQFERFTVHNGKILAIAQNSTRGVDHLLNFGGS
ncbi:MAG: nuclear transport factor 2 family protein, partial [Chloroflexi bacterium]|nr:nuclear transport factor 2 family protein [Chloroflexota bacterium]